MTRAPPALGAGWRGESRDDDRHARRRSDRRRAARRTRRRRPQRVRGALPALRSPGVWACATAARRPRSRRGRRAGDFASIWRSARATGPSAAPARRGSTPSRATRSPTAAAPRPSRRPIRRTTPSPMRPGGARRDVLARVAGAPGGRGTARDERHVVSSPTGASLSQIEIADYLGIPLGPSRRGRAAGSPGSPDVLEEELR